MSHYEVFKNGNRSGRFPKRQLRRRSRNHDCDSDSSSSSERCPNVPKHVCSCACVAEDICYLCPPVNGDHKITVTKGKYCQKIDLKVEKNLLTVCRVPLASIVGVILDTLVFPPTVHFSQLVLTYEIVLINDSNQRINCLSINDSLAGIAFSATTLPFRNSINVVKAPGNIAANTSEIIASSGQLIDPCKSYLPPCSVTKILVNLAISAPDKSFCEIRHVQNSITVEGVTTECCANDGKVNVTQNPIQPISENSVIWQTESDIMFLLSIDIVIPV